LSGVAYRYRREYNAEVGEVQISRCRGLRVELLRFFGVYSGDAFDDTSLKHRILPLATAAFALGLLSGGRAAWSNDGGIGDDLRGVNDTGQRFAL